MNNLSNGDAQANIPQENSPNTHIVFAENERPPKKATGVLRIPSPREFERGIYTPFLVLILLILTCFRWYRTGH